MMMNCFFSERFTNERCLALFPAGTIVIDSRKSVTGYERDLNLLRNRFLVLLNKVVNLQYVLKLLTPFSFF